MQNRVVFLFSGQGSQHYHMGEGLYQKQPVFKEWLDRLDDLVQEMMGISVLERLYDRQRKIGDVFDDLLYTNPAIFMVEYALAQVLHENDIEPGFVLGTSMGEFAAAVLSGFMPVAEALDLLVKQSKVFVEHCPKGGMLTILHTPRLYHEVPLLHQGSELASINYHSHFVVSGQQEKLGEIERFLKGENIACQRLPVEFPFHSSHIDGVKSFYYDHLKGRRFDAPGVPLVSGMGAGIIEEMPTDYFWQVVRRPIRLIDAVNGLEGRQGGNGFIYLDLSPFSTLANFVKNNLPADSGSVVFSFMSPLGNESKRLEQCKEFFFTKRSVHIKKEEKKMKAFLFPGQGSQQKGMGEGLFDEFSELTDQADRVLGYSIKDLCLEDRHEKLVDTRYTQPAVYVVNALSYLKKIQAEDEPDFVLGHSVGEYDALFAAGVVDFRAGLELVKKRGELMAQAKGGGMAAVMGLSADQIEEILKKHRLKNLYIANYNSSFQVVLSGLKAEIVKAEPIFMENGATHYRILNVSGAFHTPYMEEAKREFAEFIKGFTFGSPHIRVISNCTARPYKPQDIMRNMIEQITNPVRWMESIRYLLAKGVTIEDFHEVSGSNISVVKALVLRINNEAGPMDLASLEEADDQPVKEEPLAEAISPGTALESDVKAGEGTGPETPKTRKRAKERLVDRLKSKKTKKEAGRDSNGRSPVITARSLGSEDFKKEYNLKYAYVGGGMYKGIASREMVVRMGKAGFLCFFGSGGLEISQIEDAIRCIQAELKDGQPYGMNLVSNSLDQEQEERMVDLILKYGIDKVEAAAFMQITPALVRYRAKGLKRGKDGGVTIGNKILGKISRPEVAEQFLSPAPERLVEKLKAAGKITPQEADLLQKVPMADDLIVEADSGGHTDRRMPYPLIPAMQKLRDEMMEKYRYARMIRVGAAGGIGTPEAAAASFILGADFILTGSINQCTVEAGTSDTVKDMLQEVNVQDTDYAPAADLFEFGARVQVLKRGVFFPARANKLYDLYRQFNSIDEIDEKTRTLIQERYFRKSFQEIYQEVKSFFPIQEIEKAETNDHHKMALIFRWYFGYSTRLALSGDSGSKVDYQVHCGPALGAFNQWVKGTPLESWKNRHVDEIAEKIMEEAAGLLNRRFLTWMGNREEV